VTAIIYTFVPYLWVTIVLSAIILFLIVYVFKNTNILGGRYFLATLILALFWIIAQGLEMSALTLKTKLMWANIQYIPILCITCSYLLMSLRFTGNKILKKKWLYPVLFSFPIIMNILIWIDDISFLFRQNVTLNTTGSFFTISKDFGPLFYIMATFNYLIVLINCVVLLQAIKDKITIYQNQLKLLLLAVAFPVVANLVYITRIVPFRVDPTPIVFSLSSIAIFYNIFRYKLFNVIPIARSMILDNIKIGIIVLDLHGRFLDINNAARKMLDLKSQNIIGTLFVDKMNHIPECIHAFKEQQETVIETDFDYMGSYACHEISFNVLRRPDEEPIGWVIQIYDITSRKISEKIVQHAASHDPLTGLPNRAYYKTLCNAMIEKAKKAESSLVLAYVDIDNYKNINDTYGHDVGDNVLDVIAKRLVKVLPEKSIICRIGGDEFVAMFPNDSNADFLHRTGEVILESINKKIPKAGTEIYITASIGFCIFPDNGEDIEDLLRHADTAMYKVKVNNKNGYCIYSE